MSVMMIHDVLTLIGIVFLAIAAIAIVIVFLIPVSASAQDIDPCFVRDNDMFKRICEQQQIDKILDQLLERARQWNNDKVR